MVVAYKVAAAAGSSRYVCYQHQYMACEMTFKGQKSAEHHQSLLVCFPYTHLSFVRVLYFTEIFIALRRNLIQYHKNILSVGPDEAESWSWNV